MFLEPDFTEIWKKYNPSTNENGKFLLNTFVEHRKEAQKEYLRAYYLVLIMGIVFYFLNNGSSTEIDIFSLKITNLPLVKWCFLPVLCFVFYQGIVSVAQEDYYKSIIFQYLQLTIPEINNNAFQHLVSGTSFINFEFTMFEKFNKTSQSFIVLFIVYGFILIPPLIIIYVIANTVFRYHEGPSSFVKLIICSVTLLLLVRIAILVIDYFKEVTPGQSDK